MMARSIVLAWLLVPLLGGIACGSPYASMPKIDMHGHAWMTDAQDPDPEAPANRAHRERWIDALEQHNVVRYVASGPHAFMDVWQRALGARMVPGLMMPCSPEGFGPSFATRSQCYAEGGAWPDLERLEADLRDGRVAVLGELTNQYFGFAPDAPELAPYYALAESMGVPVAIHFGSAPPGTASACCPDFRLRFGDPLLLEDILVRHPELDVQLMHAADPAIVDRALALTAQYPRLYVDLSPHHRLLPRDEFHATLARFVRTRGVEDRVMFATDGGDLGKAIDAYTSAPIMTPELGRKIFFENALRFLGLEEAEVLEDAGAP